MYKPRLYHPKILIAGEYTVLSGHSALAIPWLSNHAEWHQGDRIYNPDPDLTNFYSYLGSNEKLATHFKLDELHDFISKGGRLNSNIPFGYGLGSSGTLCAAVLDRFGMEETLRQAEKNLVLIHELLREMEAYFHGRSSGLDPVVSFYERSVILQQGNIIFPEIAHEKLFDDFQLRLVDSLVKRTAQEQINKFKINYSNKVYQDKLESLAEVNQLLIDDIKSSDFESFDENWIQISKMSFDVFSEMIPGDFKTFWEQGINSEAYYCKLCGAGGGGMFLVKVVEPDVLKSQLKRFGYKVLP